MIYSYTPFDETYTDLLEQLMADSAVLEKNERTGKTIRTLPHPFAFTVNLADNSLPVCGIRRLHPKNAAAEVAWFVLGHRHIDWLRLHAPFWDKFTEADGRTVDAAYGYRWRTHFGRDQLRDACKALQQDRSNRRVYVSTWDPGTDGLDRQGQKNVPCPVGFTLSVVNGRLNSALLIRSSDVFVGLPYDVMGHAILMRIICDTLSAGAEDGWQVEMGVMHVTLAHPHIYDVHFDMARHALGLEPVCEYPQMPAGQWPIWMVEAQADDFVAAYLEAGRAINWPEYNPRPEVVS